MAERMMLEPARLAQFLERYSECFNIRRCCRELGIARSSLYEHLESHPEFKLAFNELRGVMKQNVADAVYERAVEGVERHVYYQGIKIATEREYSDQLLAMMAKAFFPEFREKTSVDLTNSDGKLQVNETQALARVESLLALARARRDRGEVIDAEVVPAITAEDLV